MKLLFVADHLRFGGAERHTVALAGALAQRRHDVGVAWLKDEGELGDELRRGGVGTLFCLDGRGGIDRAAIGRLGAHITDSAPDVIVATSQYSLMNALLARLLSAQRPPIAFVCHSMDIVRRSRRERLRFLVYRHCYRAADCVIFVSGLQQRFFARLGVRPRRVELVHSGIDLRHFSAQAVEAQALRLRADCGFGAHDLVVGLCAALREEKRHIDLLQAVAQLRAQGLPFKILLVGDGPTRAAIEACRDRLGLQDALVLAGFQQDVRPWIAACDLMALTSHAETFPIATLEYMGLGKALVASDVGGLREQVEEGVNGLLYPAGDVAALAAALRRMAEPGLRARLGQGALRVAHQRFDVQAMTARFESLFQELGAPAPAPLQAPSQATSQAPAPSQAAAPLQAPLPAPVQAPAGGRHAD